MVENGQAQPTGSPDRLIPTESNPSTLTEENVEKALAPMPKTSGREPQKGGAGLPVPPPEQARKSGAEEKKELMDKMQPPKDARPLDMAEQKGDRWEKDPTTGVDVLIRDSKFEHFRGKGLDNAALDPENPKAGTALRRPPDPSTQDARYSAPDPAEPGNICLQSFPPPVDPVDLSHAKRILRTGAMITSALCFLVWFFAATGKRVTWFQFFWRSMLIGSMASVAWIAAENAGRKIEKELQAIRMKMHTQRGEMFSSPTPESVEWLNAILKVVWGLINPEMFVPIVDMVEDILQQSLPSFVDAVRIADIGQGTNPARIVSMRALPDRPGHPDYPREEWVGLDKDEQSRRQAQDVDTGEPHDPSKQVDTDQTGDYLNYEVSLSYQALPGQRSKLRFHNMHLMLEFFVGAWDWFKLPVPFYAVVEGFVATARLRVQFVQNPPFVRNLTVTLMGVPKVEVSVEPFTKKLPNVLDLPMIQKFVEMGVAAACAQYVAPKSLTINLAQMLMGDGVKKDTKALGVFIINIHHAEGLAARDRNGKSDPYIVLAYAKFGKPLHSTRIITEELNPVWEETAFMLVTEDEVKGEEDLSAMLWDSDKRSADDLVGRVTVPVSDLMRTPNQMISRADKLRGFEDANDMPGTLHWEIGYYEKVPLNKALQKDQNANVPDEIKGKEQTHEKPTVADTQEQADALTTPPDPSIPTGILSVIVHQINNRACFHTYFPNRADFMSS
ncbi:hypothetical protein NM688_g8720 [Phlebia brevispora]|uniref:Uncharacterized protein n=1 Tax=Phlebia brevispora TaxID=194682 RepID=A0ACC1RQ13_9APHY|nr:hypothetical protein NM688_g8720 [Phlebia brevispora]